MSYLSRDDNPKLQCVLPFSKYENIQRARTEDVSIVEKVLKDLKLPAKVSTVTSSTVDEDMYEFVDVVISYNIGKFAIRLRKPYKELVDVAFRVRKYDTIHTYQVNREIDKIFQGRINYDYYFYGLRSSKDRSKLDSWILIDMEEFVKHPEFYQSLSPMRWNKDNTGFETLPLSILVENNCVIYSSHKIGRFD